jgi:hypothetical protein
MKRLGRRRLFRTLYDVLPASARVCRNTVDRNRVEASEALTKDNHFQEAGFVALLK